MSRTEQDFLGPREIADDIYVMDRGKVAHSGPASDLEQPEVRRLLTV